MPSLINQNIAYRSRGDEKEGRGTSANDAEEELSDVTIEITVKKMKCYEGHSIVWSRTITTRQTAISVVGCYLYVDLN